MRPGFENKCDDCGEVLFEGDKVHDTFFEAHEIGGGIIARYCSAMCLRSLIYFDERSEFIVKRVEKL